MNKILILCYEGLKFMLKRQKRVTFFSTLGIKVYKKYSSSLYITFTILKNVPSYFFYKKFQIIQNFTKNQTLIYNLIYILYIILHIFT